MTGLSTAVAARRRVAPDSLEYFPTHPWATRALCETAVDLRGATVWEPACGEGHMARPLAEYASRVVASDIFDYGVGATVFDFLALAGAGDLLSAAPPVADPDWIITNPPFGKLEKFLMIGLAQARRGVAILGRAGMLEGAGRYNRIYLPFSGHWTFCQFVERVPMREGKLVRKASTATAYGWLVIDKVQPRPTPFMHIPPCRARLERDEDYRWGGE